MVTLVVLLVLSQAARTDVVDTNADAKVVLVTPKRVHVTSVLKQNYEAVVGLQLLKSDTLTIPADATVALRLKNGHVVRLDDDLELKVSDIALFNAPRKDEDVKAQLERLLTEQEKAAGPSRLMGWNAEQTAANVKSSASVEPAEAKSRAEVNPVAAAAPRPPPPPAALPQPARREPDTVPASPGAPAKKADTFGGGGAGGAPGGAAGRLGGSPRGGGAALATLAVDEPLTDCVNASLDQDVKFRRSLGGKLTLRLRKGADHLRVHFTNHLPVPECAKAWATTHESELQGSIDLDIPLK